MENFNLKITDEAATAVKEYLTQAPGNLRIGVLPGGCSGFKYNLEIDPTVVDDDIIVTVNDIKILIDPFSAQYLDGVIIDYRTSMQETGFTFNNPNATGACGCGTSFTA